MSSEHVIEVQGVSKLYQIYERPKDRLRQMLSRGRGKYYREFAAIRDLSFNVERGQTLGVIGRNGAGKSTLLQMICGTLEPTSGSIRVNGRVAALLELGAGFNPEFTGRENVYISAALHGLDQQQIAAKFDQILAFAEIGDFVEQPVKTYSSGMFVRLAFAVIAHVDADVLIVDEALAVGDVFFQQKCMRFLRQFQADGGTMLFVSHDTAAVVNLCRSALWLKNSAAGDYVLGSADTVCKSYLRDFYAQHAADDSRDVSRTATQAQASRPDAGAIEYAPDDMPPNVVEISGFNQGSDAFGLRGGTFIDASFVDASGAPITVARGGEHVAIRLKVQMHKHVVHPAFGITIKDRLGQFIFSEGTDGAFRSSAIECTAGDVMTVDFAFRMPVLLQGHYAVDIAFAEGLGHDHVQHHWIHEAIALTSMRGRLVQGICGLPDLQLKIIKESAMSAESV